MPDSWKRCAVNIALAATVGLTISACGCTLKDNPPAIQEHGGYQDGETTPLPVEGENKKAFIDLLPTMDKDFAKYVVDNKFTIEDGEIGDLELEVLKDPTNQNCILQLFDQYISDVSRINPELAMELKRLPDLENMQIDGIKKLEGLEDVLALAANKKYTAAFESILNEDVTEKRKLCASLEALLWCSFDEDWGNGNLTPHFQNTIVPLAWRFSSASNKYQSERWKNFDEVVNRLNSPELVSLYLKEGFTSKNKPSNPANVTPRKAFEEGGDCDEYSIFGAYCLEENGEEAYVLKVVFDRLYKNFYPGHELIIYRDNDDLYYYIDIYFNYDGTNPNGPSPIKEICSQVVAHYGVGWTYCEIHKSNWELLQTIRNQ